MASGQQCENREHGGKEAGYDYVRCPRVGDCAVQIVHLAAVTESSAGGQYFVTSTHHWASNTFRDNGTDAVYFCYHCLKSLARRRKSWQVVAIVAGLGFLFFAVDLGLGLGSVVFERLQPLVNGGWWELVAIVVLYFAFTLSLDEIVVNQAEKHAAWAYTIGRDRCKALPNELEAIEVGTTVVFTPSEWEDVKRADGARMTVREAVKVDLLRTVRLLLK